MDRISVIIPNKNRAELLRQTLDNLLAQTLKPFEIIVVDDASTDSYPAVVSDYQSIGKEMGVRMTFTQNPAHGPGAARNAGLALSKGNYIKYCDSDDVQTLNSLEVQLATLKASGKPFVYSPYVYARQEADGTWTQADVVLTHKPLPRWLTLTAAMARGYFTVIPAMLFERNFLLDLGPWLEETVYEDYEFLWRMALKVPRPAHTPDSCYFYRLHGNQSTGNQATDLRRDEAKVRIFSQLLAHYVPGSPQYDTQTAGLLHAQISKTIRLQTDLPAPTKSLFTPWPADAWYRRYLQIENKINRMITGSNWQTFHGVNKDPALFALYVQGLKA